MPGNPHAPKFERNPEELAARFAELPPKEPGRKRR